MASDLDWFCLPGISELSESDEDELEEELEEKDADSESLSEDESGIVPGVLNSDEVGEGVLGGGGVVCVGVDVAGVGEGLVVVEMVFLSVMLGVLCE